MSECVVRMEIPQSCYNCDLRYECNAFYAPGKPKPFMKGCMIVCQLPDGHGRLVDADELKTHVRNVVKEIVDNSPTIVPAERSENMRPIDADAYAAELWKLRANYQMLDDTHTADKIMHGIFRAEQVLKEQPTVAASPWHRVEEELPDLLQFVVVCNDEGKCVVAQYVGYQTDSLTPWRIAYTVYDTDIYDEKECGPVRYWMPIEPPKEDA